MLAADDADNLGTSIAKNVATGAVKGVGDAVGAVGNTGNMADYLMARVESKVTGKPVDQVLSELQRSAPSAAEPDHDRAHR